MAQNSHSKTLGFEQSIERLEKIIQLTDSSSTELEEIISLVEEGTKLIRQCKEILQKAELRIETLENTENTPVSVENAQKENDQSDGHASFSLN